MNEHGVAGLGGARQASNREGIDRQGVRRTALSAVDVVERRTVDNIRYVFMDGWYPKVRIGGRRARVPVLVTLGVRANGQRVVLDLRLAGEESAASWGEVVASLVARHLTRPVLADRRCRFPDDPADRVWVGDVERRPSMRDHLGTGEHVGNRRGKSASRTSNEDTVLHGVPYVSVTGTRKLDSVPFPDR